jgi:muconolactone delta-isomerase
VEEANRGKTKLVRQIKADIKLIENIKAKQIARLRAQEKARLEGEELEAKTAACSNMQRIFRHYLPFRIMRAKKAQEARQGLPDVVKFSMTSKEKPTLENVNLEPFNSRRDFLTQDVLS